MKKRILKPVLMGVLIVVFAILVIIPTGEAKDDDVWLPGYGFKSDNIFVCHCPIFYRVNCICHIFNPVGGGPVTPEPPVVVDNPPIEN